MYYVVHKYLNLGAVIHLGTHAHPVANNKCGKSFQEMKNMVANKVCCMPTTTILIIALFVNKTFFSYHLFNENGEGPIKLLKGDKLD
jgi:hypothetical protein